MGNDLRRAITAAALAAVLACGTTMHEPSTDMSGEWDFSYDTMTAGRCPTAPPGHLVGCEAFGAARLTQAPRGGITGSVPLLGSCQSCGSVADFGRVTALPVVGSLAQSHLEFVVGGCSFIGQAIAGPSEYTGEATCIFDGIATTGRWRLSRLPIP